MLQGGKRQVSGQLCVLFCRTEPIVRWVNIGPTDSLRQLGIGDGAQLHLIERKVSEGTDMRLVEQVIADRLKRSMDSGLCPEMRKGASKLSSGVA